MNKIVTKSELVTPELEIAYATFAVAWLVRGSISCDTGPDHPARPATTITYAHPPRSPGVHASAHARAKVVQCLNCLVRQARGRSVNSGACGLPILWMGSFSDDVGDLLGCKVSVSHRSINR
jgi:hypothetical protein